MELKSFQGNIHTVSIAAPVTQVLERNALNLGCLTNHYVTPKGGSLTQYYRYNPSKTPDPQNKTVPPCVSECTSLEDFIRRFDYSMMLEGLTDKAIITRTDFKCDYCDKETVDLWVKSGNLLVGAFIVKHKVTPKNQYLCTTVNGGQHKSTHATWGKFDIENYNKAIQQESNGTSYRFEMRHLQTRGLSVEQTLDEMQSELQGLAGYYNESLEYWNSALCAEWTSIQKSNGTHVSPNAFVRCNEKRFFARRQLQSFFDVAYNGHVPTWAAKNYYQNNRPLFISRVQYQEYINMLCQALQIYTQKGVLQHSFLATNGVIQIPSNMSAYHGYGFSIVAVYPPCKPEFISKNCVEYM